MRTICASTLTPRARKRQDCTSVRACCSWLRPSNRQLHNERNEPLARISADSWKAHAACELCERRGSALGGRRAHARGLPFESSCPGGTAASTIGDHCEKQCR